MNNALCEIVAAEERGRLWERRVLGYPVWPLMRLERYRAAMIGGPTVIRPQTGRPGPSPVKTLALEASRAARQGLPGNDGRDIWVLSSSTYRRKTPDQTYPCIFAEHLREQLGERLRFIEVNTAGLPIEDRPDVFLLDPYLRYINACAWGLGTRFANRLVGTDEARRFAPSPPSELARRALYGHLLERLAEGLLWARRPKAVFVLCAYASLIPFQRAVRRARIPLIELQHGVIHDSHPGYVFCQNVPTRDHRPDHLLLFGSHFGDILAQSSPGLGCSWSVAGHPWLRRAAARNSLTTPTAEPKTVVVFGQYDPPVQARLAEFLPGLRGVLPSDIDIIYKAHPREPVADLRRRFEVPGVSVADPADDSYALLSSCLASITVYSTLAIEALAFSCHSIVLRSPHWTEDIRTLVEQGAVHAASSALDVIRILGQGPSHHSRWPNRLFALEEAEPDFTRLIEELGRGYAPSGRDSC